MMNAKTVFLYLAYAVLAFLVFTYLLFPGKQAGLLLADRLNHINREMKVDLNPVTPVLPLGLKTLNPEVTLFDTTRVTLDSLLVTPNLFSLLKSESSADFTAALLNGVVKGHVSAPRSPGQSGLTLTSTFSALDIAPIEFNTGETGLRSRFTLDGTFDYGAGQAPGNAKGTLRLSNLVTEVSNPLLEKLGISEFHFTTVDLAYTIKKNRMEIQSFKALGNEATITLTGSGVLNAPVEKTRLNLKGEIRPDTAYLTSFAGLSSVAMLFDDSKKGGIPFTISGTVEKPIFRL
ncbi:MAG: type II secretion system protein GspN [Desulfobacteraceae bacterium]|nr:type II secretion system protein GspN [Desulfobacteraceae bacterium]